MDEFTLTVEVAPVAPVFVDAEQAVLDFELAEIEQPQAVKLSEVDTSAPEFNESSLPFAQNVVEWLNDGSLAAAGIDIEWLVAMVNNDLHVPLHQSDGVWIIG